MTAADPESTGDSSLLSASRGRWRSILASGFADEADVRWFVGSSGFISVCRELRHHELLALRDHPDLALLLADLDDRMIAFPGVTPSQRARALLEIALVRATGTVPDWARAALSPAGADGDSITQAQVDRMVDDYVTWLSSDVGDREIQVEVPVVVSHHAFGDIVLLSLTTHPLPGVAPDIVAAPFQRLDVDFARAVEVAIAASGTAAGARYAVRSRRTGIPTQAVGGTSVGLGAAVAARRLADPSASALDPDWVFTGEVLATGHVVSLVDAEGRSEYAAKLSALGREVLVHPEVDRVEVDRLASQISPELRLEAVASVADVERRILRHLEGRRAYERAVASNRRVHPGFLWTSVGLLLLMLAAGLYHRQQVEREELFRSEAAGGDPVVVTPVGSSGSAGPIEIDATEVTIERYRLCVDHGPCPEPGGPQPPDLRQAGIDELPMTGIDALSAEVFCQFARGENWGLPTFDQMAAVAEDRRVMRQGKDHPADYEALAADGEFPSVLSGVGSTSLTRIGVSYLWGNVAEWTRTRCDQSTCQTLPELARSPIVGLRVFGMDYELITFGERPSAAWFERAANPNALMGSDAKTPSLGFRCARS